MASSSHQATKAVPAVRTQVQVDRAVAEFADSLLGVRWIVGSTVHHAHDAHRDREQASIMHQASGPGQTHARRLQKKGEQLQ